MVAYTMHYKPIKTGIKSEYLKKKNYSELSSEIQPQQMQLTTLVVRGNHFLTSPETKYKK